MNYAAIIVTALASLTPVVANAQPETRGWVGLTDTSGGCLTFRLDSTSGNGLSTWYAVKNPDPGMSVAVQDAFRSAQDGSGGDQVTVTPMGSPPLLVDVGVDCPAFGAPGFPVTNIIEFFAASIRRGS